MQSDGDSNDEKNVPEGELVLLSEREAIRKQISTMSFEDLQKLKERIGSKAYNQKLLGSTSAAPNSSTAFKRANKNRPRETSSKRPIDTTSAAKRLTPRDPRFDPLCGSYDRDTFKSNYQFLNETRKKERTALERELREEDDPKRKQKIKFLMQRMDNRIREGKKLEEKEAEAKSERQEMHRQLKRGQKPQFKKKSEKHLDKLVEKFEELKKTNRLQKHMQKRTKKLAGKRLKKLGGDLDL